MPLSGSRRYDNQLTSYDYHVHHVCCLYKSGPIHSGTSYFIYTYMHWPFYQVDPQVGHFVGIQLLGVYHYTITILTNKPDSMSVSWQTIYIIPY